MNDNYTLDILGALEQNKSKKQINTDIKQLEKTINMLRLTGTFAKGGTKKELNAYIKSLQSQLNYVKLSAKVDSKNVKKDLDNALHGMKFKDIDALNIDENKTKLKARKIIADVKTLAEKTPITVNIEYKKNKLNNDLTTYLNKNTKINESSILLEESEKLRDLIDGIDDKKSLTEATDAFRLFKSEVSATGFASKSTVDKIKSMLGHITKIGSAFGVASMAINNFVKSLQTLRSNDTIITEISKTSEMTKNQLKKLEEEAFKIASKYGQLSSSFLLATQEMARAGYDDNVKAMAELSTKAQGAGDMTAELANEYIIATDKAFKMNGSIETLTATLDGANNITNNNALTMSDLGAAMSIVGSQAASSGMKVNETTAAVSTMIATTQRSGSEMANAFKGILMNLQQVSGEVGDGEDIIDTESLTKYEQACAELGVSLSTVKDGIVSLKEPMQIIKELSEAYTQLDKSDARRANLLSAVGGKYRANALNAILENYNMYEKMLKEYADGLGSMDEEAEKKANSWQGRLNALQNSWDSFVNTLTSKEAIMDGISFFDRLIQGAEKLTDTIGEIPVVLTALNTAMVAMNKDYGITQLVNKDSGKLDIQGNLLGVDFSAIKMQKKHFEEAEGAILLWNDALLSGENNLESFGNSIINNSAQLKKYLSTCSKDAPASLAGYKTSLNAAGISTDALRLKTILLNSAISMGIGIAIQVAVKSITYLIEKEENLRQATEEAANAYKESASSIDDYASRYQELHKALLEAKGDEEETYNIKKQLLDLQTELNDKYADEHGAINLLTGDYESCTKAIKALNKETAQTFLNENKKGIDKAAKEMTKDRRYNLSYIGMSSYTDEGAALKEIAEKYKDKGIWINEDANTGTYNLILKTDAQSAYDTINAFENEVREKAKELGDEHIFNDVLDISSSELNRAKEIIDEYADIYKQALTAEIASDDSKSKVYSEALQAVEAYNEAVLKSENPYDDQNVIQAKENLDAVKNSIQGNEEELGKYSILFDDVFDQADTRLIDFDEAIKNDSGLQELAKDLEGLSDIDLKALDENVGENDSFDKLKKAAEEYELDVEELINTLIRLQYVQGEIQSSTTNNENPMSTFDQAWADSFTSENDAVKELGNTLLDLAEKGRLTIETFNETDSTDYFKNLGISADEAVSKINKLVDESKQLSSMSSQISSMSEALGTKLEDGFVDADTLAGFDVEVRGLESWDRFQEMLGSTTSSYEECEEAANALATEWVNSSDFLAQLTEQNKEYYETQLEAMGIENYEEVIDSTLALKEAKEALIDVDLSEATADDIETLISEGYYSELATEQIWSLYYAKLAESGTFLDSSSDCQSMLELADDVNLTAESIELLTELMKIYSGLENGVYNESVRDREYAYERAAQIKSELEALAKGDGVSLIAAPQLKLNNKPKKSGSGSGSGSSSSKTEKDTTKEYDWIEQAIENVEKEIKELDEVADSSYSTFSQKNAALTKEIGKVTEEIQLQQQAYEEYMQKADAVGLSDHYKELVQNGAINIEDIEDENLQEQIDGYQKWYEKAQKASDAINDLKTDLKDLHVESYKLQTENLKTRLDNDSITEKQYLKELKATYEKYYANLSDYAEQYHEAVLEYLDEEKKYLNSVASAAASLIDTEIKRIQDITEEQEEQIKGQIELLEERKKPLQDELDALDDKVRKEQLALNLQKAQYDLAKAENQRTKLVYTADKGMIYTSDPEAIRDAQKNVDDAKLEIHKQSLQDQIDVLDDEIGRYDDLIDQINKAADIQIKSLEKIKNKWQEVIDQQEYAKNITLLTGEFGANAVTKILTGNDDDLLAQWKNSYISTLQNIDMETQGYIGDMTKQITSLYESNMSSVESRFQGVADTLEKAVGTASVNTVQNNTTSNVNVTTNNDAPHYPSQDTLDFMERMKRMEMHQKLISDNFYGILSPLHEIQQNTKNMISNTNNISNVNNIANKNVQPVVNHISVTLPNVTNSTSAESLLRDLESINTKKYQIDW